MDPESSLDAAPSLPVELDGEDHEIHVADAATIVAKVIVRGRRNRLVVREGVTITPFVSVGFSATVPTPSSLRPYTIVIEGDENILRIGAGTRLGANLTVRGNRNHVEIGGGCQLHGFIDVLCSDARLTIGDQTTMVQGSIQLHETGEIVFGEDCMISSQVYVSLSDIHPIFDRATGQRINPAASVHVGDHVWIGLRSMILKGARIGKGTVVAAGAIVSGEMPDHAIIAGAPARTLREGVEWRRELSETIQPLDRPAAISQAPSRRGFSWLFRPKA